MKGQDELFQLIKSLTPSEKRYFKVNASKGGDAKSNYMQLFEAMDKQKEEYDEDLLKRKNAKKPFVKYLSAEKKQLREQILKYMRAYHSGRTVDNQINEFLQDELFFQDKGLNDLRHKTILKAKELAKKYERFHLLKEVLSRQLAYTVEFEQKKLTEPVLDLINEQKQLAVTESELLELKTKDRELFAIYRSGSDIQNHQVESRMNMLISEVEIYRPRISKWFSLSVVFYRAYANYYQTLRNWPESFECTKHEYDLYQLNEHFKEEDSHNYKVCLANLLSRASSAKEYDWFLKALNEMKAAPLHSFNEEGEVFQNVYFQEHLYYINSGQFDKAEALVPIIEEGIKTYKSKINKARLLTFQYNIMVMYFLMHRFKETVVWANLILQDKGEIKQNIRTITKVLLPIIHYELGHHDIVENLTRSAFRHLKEKKRLHEFEKLVLNYFKLMPFMINRAEFELHLKEFHSRLKEIIQDKSKPITFGMEEIHLWCISQETGVKMADHLVIDSHD